MNFPEAIRGVLGADIGGTNIKWAHLIRGEVAAEGSLPTPADGPNAVAAAIARIARDQRAGRLGVAVPGHLTPDMRHTTVIPNTAGNWDRYPLADRLHDLAGVPAVLINDARAFALAESTLGAGRDRPDALFLILGTGIGAAIRLRGIVLRGPGDRIGEIGHMTVLPDGPPCGCGARGCLEAIAGGRALAAAWSPAAPGGSDPRHAKATPKDVVDAAQAGDASALDLLASAGAALGIALGNVLTLLALNTVVIGGGVAPAFELMRPAVTRALDARAAVIGTAEFLPAALGTRAGAVGAALNASGAATTKCRDLCG
jgi:glucokinase